MYWPQFSPAPETKCTYGGILDSSKCALTKTTLIRRQEQNRDMQQQTKCPNIMWDSSRSSEGSYRPREKKSGYRGCEKGY